MTPAPMMRCTGWRSSRRTGPRRGRLDVFAPALRAGLVAVAGLVGVVIGSAALGRADLGMLTGTALVAAASSWAAPRRPGSD
jgi:hypothetical protein